MCCVLQIILEPVSKMHKTAGVCDNKPELFLPGDKIRWFNNIVVLSSRVVVLKEQHCCTCTGRRRTHPRSQVGAVGTRSRRCQCHCRVFSRTRTHSGGWVGVCVGRAHSLTGVYAAEESRAITTGC